MDSFFKIGLVQPQLDLCLPGFSFTQAAVIFILFLRGFFDTALLALRLGSSVWLQFVHLRCCEIVKQFKRIYQTLCNVIKMKPPPKWHCTVWGGLSYLMAFGSSAIIRVWLKDFFIINAFARELYEI